MRENTVTLVGNVVVTRGSNVLRAASGWWLISLGGIKNGWGPDRRDISVREMIHVTRKVAPTDRISWRCSDQRRLFGGGRHHKFREGKDGSAGAPGHKCSSRRGWRKFRRDKESTPGPLARRTGGARVLLGTRLRMRAEARFRPCSSPKGHELKASVLSASDEIRASPFLPAGKIVSVVVAQHHGINLTLRRGALPERPVG
jgi:hypothetical protein